jgi:hypothetical protein
MGENHFAPIPTALYGATFLMAGLAYNILSRAIIAAQGPDSLLRNAVGNDRKGLLSLFIYAAAIAHPQKRQTPCGIRHRGLPNNRWGKAVTVDGSTFSPSRFSGWTGASSVIALSPGCLHIRLLRFHKPTTASAPPTRAYVPGSGVSQGAVS